MFSVHDTHLQVVFVSKYLRPNYCDPGEGLGRAGSSGGMRGLTVEHLESTCSTQEHTPASWAPHCHDWNLSSETRDTWPRAVSHLSVTCRHVLSGIGTLWCVNISWSLATEAGLEPETAQQRRDLLASQLGSWEKRKVCFNLLLHLHFDICGQFRFRFWQMRVSRLTENCVFSVK